MFVSPDISLSRSCHTIEGSNKSRAAGPGGGGSTPRRQSESHTSDSLSVHCGLHTRAASAGRRGDRRPSSSAANCSAPRALRTGTAGQVERTYDRGSYFDDGPGRPRGLGCLPPPAHLGRANGMKPASACGIVTNRTATAGSSHRSPASASSASTGFRTVAHEGSGVAVAWHDRSCQPRGGATPGLRSRRSRSAGRGTRRPRSRPRRRARRDVPGTHPGRTAALRCARGSR